MRKFIFVLYALTLTIFTFFSYVFVDPNLFYLKEIYTGFIFQHRAFTTIIFLLFILILYIFYYYFLRLVTKNQINKYTVKKLIVLVSVISFPAYPAMLSYDIFNYLLTAKVTFFYQENPYIVMPIEFVGEPFLAFTHAANKLALYGPTWILLTGIPYLISFGNFVPFLYSLKIIIIFFYMATVFIIWKFTRNLFSTTFFALNPLVIIETINSGHNDIVMIFFALLSFYLLTRRKIWLGLVFLIFSIFVKYSTVFLVPVFIYGALKLLKKEKINERKIFGISALILFAVFIVFSPIREEIYPWYAIWFLAFASFISNRTFIFYSSYIFSLSLLLRYSPYMLTGTYYGQTPLLKTLISFSPLILFAVYYGIRRRKNTT